jgi:putative DNA primase/helicase
MNEIEVDEELASLSPEERLFALAQRRGIGRDPLLLKENVKLAMRMFNSDQIKGEWTKLVRLLAGWHSLREFERRVKEAYKIARETRTKNKADEEAQARLSEAEERGLAFVAEGKPVRIAEDFRAARCPDLIEAGDEFLEYHGNAYRTVTKKTVRARVQAWMASGVNTDTGEVVHPDKADLDNVMDALVSLCHREEFEAKPPAWLDEWEGVDPDPKMVIAARNGLLDVTTGDLSGLTPRFFTRNGLSFDYDPDAGEPVEWFRFLESIWPEAEGGKANHDLLQEIMGHLLTGETKYQKIFMLLGPSRAGKGTITRTITQLLGEANVAEFSARELTKDFGLSMLLGKQAFIIPDLRLGKGADYSGIAEILLNISGEDRIGANRKFKDYDVSKLNTRIVIAANKELVLPDQSGALVARYVPLVFKKSFIGREDRGLDEKIAPELPAILKWAIEGLRRLEARKDDNGRLIGFVQTPDGEDMLAEIARRGSSVVAFIKECCVLDPNEKTRKSKVFATFEKWCEEHDIKSLYESDSFAKDLRTSSGYVVEAVRLREGDKRIRFFTGLKLRDDLDLPTGQEEEDDEAEEDDY